MQKKLKILSGTILLPRHVAAIGRVRAMTQAYLDKSGDMLASPNEFTHAEMVSDLILMLFTEQVDVTAVLTEAYCSARKAYGG